MRAEPLHPARWGIFLAGLFPTSRVFYPMTSRTILILAVACVLLAGCHGNPSSITTSPATLTPPEQAAAANHLFLNQKTFDPWVLMSNGNPVPPAYIANGTTGYLVYWPLEIAQEIKAGNYSNGQLVAANLGPANPPNGMYALNFRQGDIFSVINGKIQPKALSANIIRYNWPHIWQTSDIIIKGDPEAQQVTHANLFYLLSSTYPGSDHSIPPMGLSSNLYGGHIFWDAEVWMLPALIVQHPEYAKSIVEYRFALLAQAKKNAQAHGFAGAEYPWESADTGKEMVGGDFAKERHITADVGWAAWQYYLWTGDKAYLRTEGWPILQATAQYWVSRVTKGSDGKYHIKGVLSPDETAGLVDDDAYTNAVVQADLRAAIRAAQAAGQSADTRWKTVADALYFPYDAARGIPAENDTPLTVRFQAKQADTLLLAHPLHGKFDSATLGRMLDFYSAHTSPNGPAMTASIQAVVAARLGRNQEALDQFHASYRPFERGPWDAFSEKRTSTRVYFCTGMAGCLQSVLYGFAGLQVYAADEKADGEKLAGDREASLYAAPHLPPGWAGLTVQGIRFRGKTLDLTVKPGNKVTVALR